MTTRCNMSCQICSHPLLKNKLISKNILLKVFRRIVDEFSDILKKRDKPLLNPVGLGEPLHYPNLAGALNYWRKTTGGIITLNTNGMLLDQNASKLILNYMNREGDIFIISLNASNAEAYRIFTEVDLYLNVVENIKQFSQFRGDLNYPRVLILFLEYKK
ncbi:MAG: radical SAM protein [Nitrososphaeria archaeon]